MGQELPPKQAIRLPEVSAWTSGLGGLHPGLLGPKVLFFICLLSVDDFEIHPCSLFCFC